VSKLVLHSLRNAAYRLVAIPASVIIITSFITLIFADTKFAYSIGLGGCVWILPNFYFAYKLFHRIETKANNFISVFYRTELFKLALSALLFIAIVKWLSVTLSAIFIGYFVALVSFWVSAVFTLDKI
jgi:ATP synthase protein I